MKMLNPKIIDGRKIAQEITKPLKKEIQFLGQKGIIPQLAIILVGADPESLIYIKEKEKTAKKLGIKTKLFKFSENISLAEIQDLIFKLNKNKQISGILVQLPLPKNLDTEKVLGRIALKKDVDGLLSNSPYSPPCATAILMILRKYKINLANKKIVIVGIGRLVGRPLYKILKEKKYNPTLISSRQSDFIEKVKNADILICASRKKNLIGQKMIKKEVVIIDAACNVKKDARLRASYLTPKIGGVGPVTVSLLIKNVVRAARTRSEKDGTRAGPATIDI